MHFNEMQVKSRQLGLTFVTAALGVAVVLLSNGDDFAFSVTIRGYSIQLHVSVLLVLGALIALNAVKQLDLNVYHRMLRGAVTFGEDFEANYMSKIFDLEQGMTQTISHFSRFEDAYARRGNDGRYAYCGQKKITAYDKIRKFYRNTNLFLAFAAGVLLLLTNVTPISQLVSDDPRMEQTIQDSPSGDSQSE